MRNLKSLESLLIFSWDIFGYTQCFLTVTVIAVLSMVPLLLIIHAGRKWVFGLFSMMIYNTISPIFIQNIWTYSLLIREAVITKYFLKNTFVFHIIKWGWLMFAIRCKIYFNIENIIRKIPNNVRMFVNIFSGDTPKCWLCTYNVSFYMVHYIC